MAAREKPNILWISFEDTNPFYGCYGDAVARTPHLDALAAQGCRWTHCFSTAGVCAPARSAVITGMYPISIGTHHMRTNPYRSRHPGTTGALFGGCTALREVLLGVTASSRLLLYKQRKNRLSIRPAPNCLGRTQHRGPLAASTRSRTTLLCSLQLRAHARKWYVVG